MNWEQKLLALQAIAFALGCSLKMRSPGDWYVSLDGIDIKKGNMLIGAYGNGSNPEEAVNATWDRYVTNISAEECVAITTLTNDGRKRRYVRWNGYMWCDVEVS